MKSLLPRVVASLLFAAACLLILLGASSPKGSNLQPDKLVILSTTDVKGKTSPCG